MISSDILTVPAASQSLYGKSVKEMVNNVKVSKDGNVTGTFLYVKNFTQFNENNPLEQEGHFFPFRLTNTGKKMTFKKNGLAVKEDIEFEAENVFRISDSNTTFTVIVDGNEIVTFKFAKAVFQQKQS